MQSLSLQFSVIASHIDETTDLKNPREIVTSLSLSKAKEVAAGLADLQKRTLILAADTIVVLEEHVLGKPQSQEEALAMLMLLSGREHQVYTGVSIVEMPGANYRSICQVSSVYFRRLEISEARYYAAGHEPVDKAGAYALQGTAGAFVERVEGCYTNIIGLPLSATVQLLREFGLTVLGCGRQGKKCDKHE